MIYIKNIKLNVSGYLFNINFDSDYIYKDSDNTFKKNFHFSQYTIQQKININVYSDLYQFDYIKEKHKKIGYSEIETFENEVKKKYSDDFYSESSDRYFINQISENTFNMYLDYSKYKFYDIMYILREIYVRLHENNYSLFMHGSSIEIDDKGTLIIGDSDSGKTTLMMKLIEESSKDVAFISNDRTFIDGNNNLVYFPIPINFAVGTARLSKRINDYFYSKEKDYRKKLIELGEKTEKFPVIYSEFSNIMSNISMKDRTKLNTILMPYMDLNKKDYLEINESRDIGAIQRSCFTPNDRESLRRPWIYKRNFSENDLSINSNLRIKTLLDDSQVYSICFPPDIPNDELKKTLKKRMGEKNGAGNKGVFE